VKVVQQKETFISNYRPADFDRTVVLLVRRLEVASLK